MASYLSVALWKVIQEEGLAEEVQDQGVVETIEDPGQKAVHPEEEPRLAERVELRVAVQKPGRDELVENAKGEWWKRGKEDVVER